MKKLFIGYSAVVLAIGLGSWFRPELKLLCVSFLAISAMAFVMGAADELHGRQQIKLRKPIEDSYIALILLCLAVSAIISWTCASNYWPGLVVKMFAAGLGISLYIGFLVMTAHMLDKVLVMEGQY